MLTTRDSLDLAYAETAQAEPARSGRFMRSVAAQAKRTQGRLMGALRSGQRVPTSPKQSSPTNTNMSSRAWAAGNTIARKRDDDLDKSGIGPFITKDWMEEEIDMVQQRRLSGDGAQDVDSRRQAEAHETCTFLDRKRDSQRIKAPAPATGCPWQTANGSQRPVTWPVTSVLL